jgi:hypothetical protein
MIESYCWDFIVFRHVLLAHFVGLANGLRVAVYDYGMDLIGV